MTKRSYVIFIDDKYISTFSTTTTESEYSAYCILECTWVVYKVVLL